jgi:transcriptional regulator with XRE-family HTH domain
VSPHEEQVPPICRALRDTLDAMRMSHEKLAQRLGVRQSSVTKWATTREPRLDRISSIESALGMPKGALLARAGYVEGAPSVPLAIDLDTTLKQADKATLRRLYELFMSDANSLLDQ